MVQRVALILGILLALIAAAAPRVTATFAAQANPNIYRPASPGDSLDNRWRWALNEARRMRVSEFWIAYSFETPVHAGDLVMTDSNGNSFVSSGGRVGRSGPTLMETLRDGGGNIVVLLHYRGTGDTDFDRAHFRSARLGFDFQRKPVFWLGYADESQSFNRVRSLFERSRVERLQTFLIELASMHGNSNAVIPFLTELVAVSHPSAIRIEAAEGFGHHHDPRSVEVLLRVARTDPTSEVRAEAAETIGEVQVSQAIPALTQLVEQSEDAAVLAEATEAFADLSPDTLHPQLLALAASGRTPRIRRDALDAIADAVSETGDAQLLDRAEQAFERAVFDDPDASVRMEALDACEKLPRDRAVRMYQRVIDKHPDNRVRREAGEQLRERRR